MCLIYAGIDEAGYGPLLGPLCVGLSVFRVAAAPDGSPPDLWATLKRSVCRAPERRGRRIAVADSKALKLANDIKTRHPLVHLERGVLSFVSCLGDVPGDDAALCERLGVRLEERPWYAGGSGAVPVAHTAAEVSVARAGLTGTLELAGVEVLGVRCTAVGEAAVNEAIRRTNSKAEATVGALGAHLRAVAGLVPEGAAACVVCDRLGGRSQYGAMLGRELPGSSVEVIAEAGAVSAYEVSLPRRRMQVQFLPEAESAHLPVALASMVAKYVRELAMARFNRHWCGRVPDLKPTAGYYKDARRWLDEAGTAISGAERAALVRLA